MRLRMRTMIFVLLVSGSIISGCGGNGGTASVDPGNGDPPPPTPTPVDLTDLSAAALGTVMISEGTVITAGHTMTVGDVTFSCPSGGSDCTLAQTADGVTSTGGQATAMLAQRSVDLAALSNAARGTIANSDVNGTEVTAGDTVTSGDITFSCPSGGANCTLAKTNGEVTSTGGQATAMLAQRSVDLAALSNAARGTVTIPAGTVIPAGQMLRIGDVTFSCPAGGAACTLAQSNGDVTATGGQATAALALADVNLAGLSDDARGTIAIPPGAVIRAGETKRIGDVTFSCPAGGADCTLALTVDGGVTSTGGLATAAVSQVAQDRMAGHTAAIGQSGPLNKAARPGGTNLALTLAPDGTMSYLGDRLGVPDDGQDGAANIANEFQPSNLPRATIDGWTNQVFHRELPERNTEDVLTVYHDRQAAQGRQYMSFFARANQVDGIDAPNTADDVFLAPNRRPAIVTGIIDYGDATNPANPDPGLNLNARAGIFDANRAGEGTLILGNDTAGEDDVDVAAEEIALFTGSIFTFATGETRVTHDAGVDYTGTFYGLSGTYQCVVAAGCDVANDGGTGLTLGPGWRFVPDNAMGTVANVQMDVDYLSFGYWVQTVTAPDGTQTYGVNTFANGSLPFGDNSGGNAEIAALTGTATYKGRATGMYAVQRFDTGDGVPSETGQFTAEAKLTASFGGGGVALDDQFSIRGNVTNFRDTANTPISNGEWNVALGRADFVTREADGSITANTYMNNFGGATTGGGTWTGGFFGMTAAQVNDAVVDPLELPAAPETTYPTGVAGEFNAHLGNGHVIGAFGATRQ